MSAQSGLIPQGTGNQIVTPLAKKQAQVYRDNAVSGDGIYYGRLPDGTNEKIGGPGAGSGIPFGNDTNAAANVIQVTLPGFVSLVDDYTFEVRNLTTNTGATQLQIGASGLKDVVDTDGNPLAAGMLADGSIYLFAYDATKDKYELLGLAKPSGSTSTESSNFLLSADGTSSSGGVLTNPGSNPTLTVTTSKQIKQLGVFSANEDNIIESYGMYSEGLQSLIRNSNLQNIDFSNILSVLNGNISNGFNGPVFAIAQQSDGKILVGGNFSAYNDISANGIIRLNKNGTIDSTFVYGTGTNDNVFSIAIQNDGKIILGGDFSDYNGTAANRIIRINTNGSVDGTFVYGTGFDDTVYQVVLQSNGSVVVGGRFTNYNGTGANSIIRLTTLGAIDGTFVYGAGFNAVVRSIIIDLTGNIVVGGSFTSYKGTGANRIIRITTLGAIDGTFVYGAGFDANVLSLKFQSTGKIIAGGAFTTYDGNGSNKIIRLNADGSFDGSFVATGLGGFDNNVNSIAVKLNDKIIVGGVFTVLGPTPANKIIGLASDGSIDDSFSYTIGFNNDVNVLSIQSDGKILVGGAFTSYSYNTIPENRFVRLNVNGVADILYSSIDGWVGLINNITSTSFDIVFTMVGNGLNIIGKWFSIE